jgi:phosphoribosylformimino-5-aminoimidazole carboxamide ribotide isomerase
MLIPSIDLLSGKVVQLVQGEKKALEYDSFEPWVERFSAYPMVQLIDLDAAMRTDYGDNRAIVEQIAGRLPVQVGGGIRTVERAQQLLAIGARKVIIGSSLFRNGGVDLEFARSLSDAVGEDKLIFSVDSKGGHVTVAGWKESTPITATDAVRALEPFCSDFLYTHVDTEGTLAGFPIHIARELQSHTQRKLIVAGGIRRQSEIDELSQLGIDCVVGMAIYTGILPA